eukprot:CCRYP_020517-RA/>CCRYP_020517-RA protein AED:0.18 eAED:0.18 QI:0/-1/0/1/-1/1/1/0/524
MPKTYNHLGKKPPSSNATSSSRGPRLLLLSVAGVTAAVGTTLCRLLLSETGTVLLLFSSQNDLSIESSLIEGLNFDCATDEHILTTLGKALVQSSSSPYLRSAPLIFLFLSSAAFVVGVILTRQELRYFCAQYQSQPPVQNLADCSWNEIVDKVKAVILAGRQTLGRRLESAVEFVDNMVADDVLRKIVKTGNEVAAGVAGGVVLYSLPDDIIPQTTTTTTATDATSSCRENNVLTLTSQVKSARRRVIYAVDPSLDDILFRPGGLWSITPAGFRDTLISWTRSTAVERPSFVCDAPTLDSTADGSGSHDLEEEKLVTSHGSLPKLIHVRQPQQIVAAAAVPDGNLENAASEEAPSKNGGTLHPKNYKPANKDANQSRETPSPTPLQIEKALQRTAIAASLCFVLQLLKSPSTRKTWRSAMSFSASCGLLSTAIGAGLASQLLRSTLMKSASNENSIFGALCLNTLERITSFQCVHAKILGMVNRTWEEIKANKRLQMSLAFTVLYGFHTLTDYSQGRQGKRVR